MKKFNVIIGESTDSNSDVNINDEFESENLDTAVEYVKRNYVKSELVDELEEQFSDDKSVTLSYSYWTTEQGEDTDEEFDEEKHTWFNDWVEITEIDEFMFPDEVNE